MPLPDPEHPDSYAIDGLAGFFVAETATFTGSSFTDNSAISFGGAIYSLGDVDLIDSTLSRNTAGAGAGAVWAFGDVDIVRSLLTSNTAAEARRENPSHGGAVRAEGTLTALSTTFSDNVSDYGGALSTGGEIAAPVALGAPESPTPRGSTRSPTRSTPPTT